MPPKLKITKIPGTNELGPSWDVHEIPEHLVGMLEMPEPESITFTDPVTEAQTTYLVKDLAVEVHEGKTTAEFTRAMWKKNGGYPPGRTKLRDAAFPGEPLEDRLIVEPPQWKPTKTLARRKAAVNKVGGPVEKALVQAEEDAEREDFAAFLEQRKSNGPI